MLKQTCVSQAKGVVAFRHSQWSHCHTIQNDTLNDTLPQRALYHTTQKECDTSPSEKGLVSHHPKMVKQYRIELLPILKLILSLSFGSFVCFFFKRAAHYIFDSVETFFKLV